MSNKDGKKPLLNVVAGRLIVIFIVSVLGMLLIMAVVSYRQVREQDIELTTRAVEDMKNDVRLLIQSKVRGIMAEHLSAIDQLRSEPGDPSQNLVRYRDTSDLPDYLEVNIIDREGVVVASTSEAPAGPDVDGGGQSAGFLASVLSQDDGFYLQAFEPDAIDPDRKLMYAGMAFRDGSGVFQLVLNEQTYNGYLKDLVPYAVTNRRLGTEGYVLVVLNDGLIFGSYHDEHTGRTIEDAGIRLDPARVYDLDSFVTRVFGVRSNVIVSSTPIYYIVGVYPITEAMENYLVVIRGMGMYMFIVFVLLFATLFIVLKRDVVNSIVGIAGTMASVAAGNLDERVDVHTTAEFDSLSNDINETVDTLKRFIEAEKNRNAEELKIAREIQLSAMPGRFPPYPDRSDFSIFANINAAHEVGGDFYDFYLLDDQLVFLIADVSGKGIPAAMFMMRAKTMIRNMAEAGLSPAEVFTEANRRLCAENESGMFVTAWIGYLDTGTGLVRIANAGHNPAVHIHDGEAAYIRLKPGLMLGAFDTVSYRMQELRLEPGDCVYLYTDGVTEAMDAGERLYGETRLLETLASSAARGDGDMCARLCEAVLGDVRAFAEGAEQADDITMLCVRYEGKPQRDLRQE